MGVLTIVDLVLSILKRANASADEVVEFVSVIKALLPPKAFPELTTAQLIDRYRNISTTELADIRKELARLAAERAAEEAAQKNS